VIEHIRIVEIEGYDYSPCGGTHVLQTGSIGLLKVFKSERQNEKTRIYFVAGLQAFNLFRQMYDSLTGLATKMSTGWQDIPELMSKQSEQITLLQKEILPLRRAGIKLEVQELAARAEERQGFKIVQASFENRPVPELRMLAEELKGISAVVSYLASFDGKKLSLIVTCAEDTGMDARQVLNKQLVKIGGRGGGDARLAQGGGLASQDQFNLFLQPGELD
jgi:alanyl-tRNA synthetase